MRIERVLAGFAFGLFAVSLSATAASAQVGARAGATWSGVSADSFDDHKGRTGFYVALSYAIPLSERWTLRPELGYSQFGFSLEETVDDPEEGPVPFDTSLSVEADYLVLPLLFEYRFGGSSISPYIAVGPQFGFVLFSDIVYDYGDDFFYDTDTFNSIDAGLTAAVGVALPISDTRFSIDVQFRYYHSALVMEDEIDGYHRQAGLLAGFRF